MPIPLFKFSDKDNTLYRLTFFSLFHRASFTSPICTKYIVKILQNYNTTIDKLISQCYNIGKMRKLVIFLAKKH